MTHNGPPEVERMEKRFAKRMPSRVKVVFGPQAPEALGFALNLSADGLFMTAVRLFPPPTRLQIRLEPIGAAAIDVCGRVAWGLRVPQRLLSVVKPGMGIRLESPPREYLDFFFGLMKASGPRSGQRADGRLEVRFYRREHFIKEYTENISHGGLFVPTEEVLEPGSEARVDLMVPELATVWQVAGRVAYRLDAGQARQLDSPPGIGLELTEVDPKVEEAFRTYVQKVIRLYE